MPAPSVAAPPSRAPDHLHLQLSYGYEVRALDLCANSACSGHSHDETDTLPHSGVCAECGKVPALCTASPVQEEFTLKVMTLSASWAPTADQPHIVVLGEPVGRGADVPDEGRDRHDGRARPRAEERTERALRARGKAFSDRVTQ